MLPVILSFLLALAAPAAFATPCALGLLSTYEALGSAGCDLGPFTVKDFNYTLIASSVTIADTDITVTPIFGASSFGLTFSSSKFDVKVRTSPSICSRTPGIRARSGA